MAMAVHRVVAGIGEYREFQEPLKDGAVIELSLVENPKADMPQFEVVVINGTTPSVEQFINVVVKNNTKDSRIVLKFTGRIIYLAPGKFTKVDEVDLVRTKGWEIAEVSRESPPRPPARPKRDWKIVVIITGIVGVAALLLFHLFKANHTRTV